MADHVYQRILHDAQREIFNDPNRYRVCVNGRRFGKSRLVLEELIRAALGFTGIMSATSPQVVLGTLPTAVQARPILFKPLVNLFTDTNLKYFVDKINLTEMRIDILGKPSIRIAGANDRGGDRLRGNRIYFIAMDEAQDTHSVVWNEVVMPAMADTEGSRAFFSGTPKGKQNFLYDLSRMPEKEEGWAFFNFPTSSNPTIPREEIERARRVLAPKVFEQEFEASFTNFEGQWYSELDSLNMHEDAQLPHFDLVVLGVDFGDLHPAAAVWAREPIEQCWYYLAGWSPNSYSKENQPVPREMFDNAIRRLVEQYKVQLIFCDPSRPSEILSIRKLGSNPAFKSAVEGFNGIQEGIGQVHNLIFQKKLMFCKHSAFVDRDAVDGTLAYEFHQSYTRVKKDEYLTDEPEDGLHTHIVDASRYALAIKKGR